MRFLNTYFAFAIPQVMSHGGFIDKFIGDAIMCLFTQRSVEEQTVSAVSAAVGMLQDLEYMNGLELDDCQQVRTGIGINTGEAIMGVIGIQERMESTVLGSSVNLASRIESLCKFYQASLLISGHTYEGLGEQRSRFKIRFVDMVIVRGTTLPCEIYEVFDGDPVEIGEFKGATLARFEKAMSLYKACKFQEAQRHFGICAEQSNARDRIVQLYVERCEKLLDQHSPNVVLQPIWGLK